MSRITGETVTSPITGELFAAIALVEWERLVELAVELGPCQDECGAAGCQLAKRIAKLNLEVAGIRAGVV